MGRRQKRPKKPADTTPSKPWYQRAWVGAALVGGVITTIVSGIGTILTNGPTYIANAEKMPGEFERVSNKFLSWLYEDERWNGYFGTAPEAYADLEDMRLTKSDPQLNLHLYSQRGFVGGEITSKAICGSRPFPDYLMLEGRVSLSGNSARVVAWDVVGGRRQNYFAFTIEQDGGVVLTLTHVEGLRDALPETARVARYPDLTVDEKVYEALRAVCSAERKAFTDALHERRRQLGIAMPPASAPESSGSAPQRTP